MVSCPLPTIQRGPRYEARGLRGGPYCVVPAAGNPRGETVDANNPPDYCTSSVCLCLLLSGARPIDVHAPRKKCFQGTVDTRYTYFVVMRKHGLEVWVIGKVGHPEPEASFKTYIEWF